MNSLSLFLELTKGFLNPAFYPPPPSLKWKLPLAVREHMLFTEISLNFLFKNCEGRELLITYYQLKKNTFFFSFSMSKLIRICSDLNAPMFVSFESVFFLFVLEHISWHYKPKFFRVDWMVY